MINNMVPCCHIYKISFLLSALCLHLQNLIFIWCLVGKFTKSHKYKAPTSFLHGALWSHLQNLIKHKAPTRHFLVPCTRQKPGTHIIIILFSAQCKFFVEGKRISRRQCRTLIVIVGVGISLSFTNSIEDSRL